MFGTIEVTTCGGYDKAGGEFLYEEVILVTNCEEIWEGWWWGGGGLCKSGARDYNYPTMQLEIILPWKTKCSVIFRVAL